LSHSFPSSLLLPLLIVEVHEWQQDEHAEHDQSVHCCNIQDTRVYIVMAQVVGKVNHQVLEPSKSPKDDMVYRLDIYCFSLN